MLKNKKILFRCSSIGNLMVESKETKITPTQLNLISELEQEKNTGINKNGNKIKWTDSKQKELDGYIAKRDAPPQLSETAKREIEKVWLLNEKGFYKEIDNRFIMKGLFTEEDGISLISELDNEFYVKNTERKTKGNLTGECDILHFLPNKKKVIKDNKSCYDSQTFMNATMDIIYESQGRGYMYLYDADEFHLEFTLNDLPQHLLESEIWKIRNKYGIMDPDSEQARPIIEQIRRNYIYSDNPAYTLEERRKQFIIYRDKVWEKKLKEKLKLALAYYKTIKLNQK